MPVPFSPQKILELMRQYQQGGAGQNEWPAPNMDPNLYHDPDVPMPPNTGRMPEYPGIMDPAQRSPYQRTSMQDSDPSDAPHDWRNYDYNTPTIHPGGQINLLPTRSDMPTVDPYDLPEGEQRWVPRKYPGGRT